MPSTRPRRAQPIPTAVGIGLRPPHIEQILEQRPSVPFFELHSENLFCAGGPMWDVFEQVRRDYPVSLHGVGLSLGSADALDPKHLQRLRELVARAAPALVSEHVCWGAIGGRHFNDLLPLPYTEEALALMVEHVHELQQTLQRQVLLENVSSYIHYTHSTMPEWEFLGGAGAAQRLRPAARRQQCLRQQHQPRHRRRAYLDSIDPAAVGEIHLAGFSRKQGLPAGRC